MQNKADMIFNRTTCRFSFVDRLKILLTGVAILELEIDCEIAPGMLESRSRAYTPRLFPSKSEGGYAEVSRG